MPVLSESDAEALILNNIVRDENGCWVWQKRLDDKGYASCYYTYKGKRYQRTQRLSYAIFKEPPHPDLVLDHLCRNRPCINPDHLEQVTSKENVLRGEGVSAKNAVKTHCKQGHEFNEKNTYYYTRKQGTIRFCKKCRSITVNKIIKAKRMDELKAFLNAHKPKQLQGKE